MRRTSVDHQRVALCTRLILVIIFAAMIMTVVAVNVFSSESLKNCRYKIQICNVLIGCLSFALILIPQLRSRMQNRKECLRIMISLIVSLNLISHLCFWIVVLFASAKDSNWLTCMPLGLAIVNLAFPFFCLFLVLITIYFIKLIRKTTNHSDSEALQTQYQASLEQNRLLMSEIERLRLELSNAESQRALFGTLLLPHLFSSLEQQR